MSLAIFMKNYVEYLYNLKIMRRMTVIVIALDEF